MAEFVKELEALLNRFGKDNEINVPDYILAKLIEDCLVALGVAIVSLKKHEQSACLKAISL